MPHYLHSDTNTVAIYPDYDYSREDTKIRTAKRTKDGSLFIYNWATFERFKMKVNYLTSSETLQINNWWTNDTPLSYVNNSGDVHSCYLISNKLPIGKVQKPYQSLNKGIIELESS